MKSKIKYNKKIANSFHNTEYYESNEYNIKNKEFLEKETKRLKTNYKENVTKIIEEKRSIENGEKVFIIIKNIYEKNKKAAFENNEGEIENVDLTNLVASIPLLMVSYAKVRKNRGSVTLAHYKSEEDYNNLDPDQKNLINKINKGADGISLEVFRETSRLIKKGKYPWGTSKRIYLDKPGKPGAKRPITIPPFMDRVVQEAIRYILVAIYEPYFDKMHVSFGFRPNRSVHDAIYSLTNYTTQGLNMALEGDIKSAYDKVNREKLLKILGKKIKDKKFLNLIKNRMDYEFYDSEKDIFVKDKEGIPQGGTDSPYLWNIYMLEFDKFIFNEINQKIEKINLKTRGPNSENKRFLNNQRNVLSKQKYTISRLLTWIHLKKKEKGEFKEDLKKLEKESSNNWHKIDPLFPKKLLHANRVMKECNIDNNDEDTIRDILQKLLKKAIHSMNNMPFLNLNKKKLRFAYCRYADDWLILCNFKEDLLMEIKEMISKFLKEELDVTLSEEKTLITNIEENPAHFLGFEIKTYRGFKIGKYLSNIGENKNKKITAKIAGNKVFALIDKQRMIDRSHMKGYCDKNGFPREITKLNNLEAFTIIEKTNSVLLGITNYYVNFIRMPKTELSRWVYIIRYSCFKTLALKHKTSIRDILKKFKSGEYNKKGENTIEDTVIIEVNGEKYRKTWKLLTMQSLMEECRGENAQKRKAEIEDRFWNLRKNKPEPFEEKEEKKIKRTAKKLYVGDMDFLERSKWVNIRTQSSFDLPCAICGCEENIEMHHIKHVRRTKYINIKKEKTWEQVMGLRNRRQMPVCRSCHMNIIHKGNYGGRPLNSMTIDKMYDNRIINVESYIHKGELGENCKKSLLEKGWTVEKDKED